MVFLLEASLEGTTYGPPVQWESLHSSATPSQVRSS